MVVKTEPCFFSGSRIYPGRGTRFVRGDSKVFLFVNGKSSASFHHKWNPRKMAWTVLYRRAMKKGTSEEIAKRRARKTTVKALTRGIGGASLEAIKAKRTQKPEVRALAREAALREVKERNRSKQTVKRTEAKKNPGAAQKATSSKMKQPKANSKAMKGSGARR